jgi:group I intron endonuclease
MRYEKHGLSGVCGVYLITNKLNGKKYVGASVNVAARISQHFGRACRLYKDRLDFYKDIHEMGRDSFEYRLLERCTPENKIERELFWWEKLRPEYNLTPPTDQPFLNDIVRERALSSTLKPENQAKLNAIKKTAAYRKQLHDAQAYKMRACYGVSEDERTPKFECISEAAQWIVDRTGKKKITVVNKIKAVLDGERATAYGYCWYEGGGCDE